MTNGWLDVIKEAVKLPALLTDIYGDLLKPGVKQVGKSLETVFGLGNTILLPLTLLNEKASIILRKNLDKYREEIQGIPVNDLAQVPPEIGVPIIEKLTYVSDYELSALYVNLLAKASTIHTNALAHPGFINIINNLCPDEVIFLKELYRLDPIPFVSVSFVNKKEKTFNPIGDLLTGVEKEIRMLFPENTQAYLSNFEGLGLIRVRRDIFLSRPASYDSLKKLYRPQFEALPSYDKTSDTIEFKEGKIDVTPYGNMFMKACLSGLLKELQEVKGRE